MQIKTIRHDYIPTGILHTVTREEWTGYEATGDPTVLSKCKMVQPPLWKILQQFLMKLNIY